MRNFVVILERQGQILQRLQLVARNRAAALTVAMELVPWADRARVVLEGEW